MKLVKLAAEEKQKEMLFMQYLARLPFMTNENYMTFNEYLEACKPIEIDRRPKDLLIDDIKRKQERLRKEG
jgi:hypothetical protein